MLHFTAMALPFGRTELQLNQFLYIYNLHIYVCVCVCPSVRACVFYLITNLVVWLYQYLFPSAVKWSQP